MEHNEYLKLSAKEKSMKSGTSSGLPETYLYHPTYITGSFYEPISYGVKKEPISIKIGPLSLDTTILEIDECPLKLSRANGCKIFGESSLHIQDVNLYNGTITVAYNERIGRRKHGERKEKTLNMEDITTDEYNIELHPLDDSGPSLEVVPPEFASAIKDIANSERKIVNIRRYKPIEITFDETSLIKELLSDKEVAQYMADVFTEKSSINQYITDPRKQAEDTFEFGHINTKTIYGVIHGLGDLKKKFIPCIEKSIAKFDRSLPEHEK